MSCEQRSADRVCNTRLLPTCTHPSCGAGACCLTGHQLQPQLPPLLLVAAPPPVLAAAAAAAGRASASCGRPAQACCLRLRPALPGRPLPGGRQHLPTPAPPAPTRRRTPLPQRLPSLAHPPLPPRRPPVPSAVRPTAPGLLAGQTALQPQGCRRRQPQCCQKSSQPGPERRGPGRRRCR